MTLTFNEYLNLVFIGYFLLLIFTGHAALIAKPIYGDGKTHRRRKKNFFWGWVIIIVTMVIILISRFFLKIEYSPNLKNDLFYALLPLLASGIVMLYWRYHGPVITFSEDKPEIQECKFLFTFSKHYDIKYDTFYLSYRKNDHFILEKFERAYFQIRFDCPTLDKLYLYFMPLFQEKELEYTLEQKINTFFNYVEEEIIAIVRDAVKKNIYSLEGDYSYNPGPLLRIIKSELTEQITLQYGINPIIEEISFYGVGSSYSISGSVTKDDACITKV